MRFIRITLSTITVFLVMSLVGCEEPNNGTTQSPYSDPKVMSEDQASNRTTTPDFNASSSPLSRDSSIGIDTYVSTDNSVSTYEDTYTSPYSDTYVSTYAETYAGAETYTSIGTEEYVPSMPENYLNVYEIHLNAGDIPRGYELNEIEPLDNFTIASGWPDAHEALDRYESWGRIEGYEVKFNKTRDLDINLTGVFSDIYVACSTYDDISGAKEDFTFEEQGREGVYKDFVRDLGGTNYAIESIPDLEIGDDSMAQKITYTNSMGSGNIDTTRAQVIFRTSYVVCNVHITILGEIYLEDTELKYLAKNQDYLIRSALARNSR